MKKAFIFVWIMAAVFASCHKDDDPPKVRINKLYEAKVFRLLPDIYVMRMDNGHNLYAPRWRLNIELREGDFIDYEVSRFCPDEITRLNGIDLVEETKSAAALSSRSGISNPVATDPVEANIVDLFAIEMITMIPMVPQTNWCIEIETGKLLICEQGKIDFTPAVGDHIVYNTYRLYPNEVVLFKKLN